MKGKEEMKGKMKELRGLDKAGYDRVFRRELSFSKKLQGVMGVEEMTVEELIWWMIGEE